MKGWVTLVVLVVGSLALCVSLGAVAADETRLGTPISWSGPEPGGRCPRSGLPDSPAYSGCGGEIAPAVNQGYEQEVVELVNAERAARGLPPLKRVIELDQSSRYHATDMGQDDYFDHDTYDRVGGNLVLVCGTWDRIQAYYPSPQAENIAAGYTSPQSVMNGWMNSDGHRANILSTNSWEFGVGYYEGGGSYYRYWVQNFGKRSDVYPLIINQEAATTNSRDVSLYVYGTWDEIRLRNDDGVWSDWQPFQSTLAWTLASVGGERAVWAEMRSGGQTASSGDSIFLDLAATPPDALAISGPVLGQAGTSYTFSAEVSPGDATQPLTYVWNATDQAEVTHQGGLSDSVSFTWSTSGPKAVTVAASNEAGEVTDSYQIVIQVPLANVSIGEPVPPGGYWVNTYYTFDATVSPVTATQPVTYVWQASGHPPVTHGGGLSDSLALAWGLTGTQTLTVTASNAAGGQVVDIHTLQVVEGPCVDVDPGVLATLVYTDGQGNPTLITVPPQAVSEAISLCYRPLTVPQPFPSDWTFAQHTFRLEAYQGGTLRPTLVLIEPFTITLHYSQADVGAMDQSSLNLYFWNGGDWLEAAITCGGTALPPQVGERWLEVEVCEIGEFALFGIQRRVYLPIVVR